MTTKTSKLHTVNVVPIPAPRPRLSKFGTAYMPASYKAYQKAIAAQLPQVDVPLSGELDITILFVCKPIAKSKFSTPMGDVDNFSKGLMDALTDEGWWEDDRQVMSLFVQKRFPEADEEPHIQFSISERT
jgi:Holliday junction resolvase RusA-like endonuclease